jgi:hypothetical protein
MRRSVTTGFGMAAIVLAGITGCLALVGLLAVLARPDLPPDQREHALVVSVASLAGRGALLLSGLLLLRRSRYAGSALGPALLLAVCQATWVFVFFPVPGGPVRLLRRGPGRGPSSWCALDPWLLHCGVGLPPHAPDEGGVWGQKMKAVCARMPSQFAQFRGSREDPVRGHGR